MTLHPSSSPCTLCVHLTHRAHPRLAIALALSLALTALALTALALTALALALALALTTLVPVVASYLALTAALVQAIDRVVADNLDYVPPYGDNPFDMASYLIW